MVNGINLAIIELFLFYQVSSNIMNDYPILTTIDEISYYWIMFTVMTGIWEASFIYNRKKGNNISKQLLRDKSHVWTNRYNLSSLRPDRFALQFYGEYGAYADREYMIVYDDWSAIIEGSHALICGGFSVGAIYNLIYYNNIGFVYYTLIAMSAQWMNSVLYIGQYMIQTKEEYHINQDRQQFPTGKWLEKRPFFYINMFWTLMPMYVVWTLDDYIKQQFLLR